MSYEKYSNYNSETDPMRFVINPLGVKPLAAFSSLTIKPLIPNRGLINARSTTRLAGWWHGKNVINQANFDTLATARKPFRAADALDQLHHRTELLQSPYASKIRRVVPGHCSPEELVGHLINFFDEGWLQSDNAETSTYIDLVASE